MPFADRKDAGRRLADRLGHLKDARPIVLALPRGGVPVGVEIARALDAPLDLVLVRKIGVPFQPELAAGAVVDGANPIRVWNPEVLRSIGMAEEDFEDAVNAELAEIEQRRRRYLAGRPPARLSGRTAIVVDDGIATGATVTAALRAIRSQQPARIVLATPVAPPEVLVRLRREADEVICLEAPAHLGAIGYFYDDFSQLSDAEVIALLAACRAPEPAPTSALPAAR
jgi:putative phosphoribosyl transferase